MDKLKFFIFFLGIAILNNPSFCRDKAFDFKDPTSPWGVNIHILSCDAKEWEMIEYLNVDWVRIDMDWRMIEPENNRYIWDYQPGNLFDCTVQNAAYRGLNILATLSSTPAWMGKPNSIPKVEEWVEFVKKTVERYDADYVNDCPEHPVIRYWGLWNEPDHPEKRFWDGTVEQYRDIILIPGYRAAKEADPACKVVGLESASYVDHHWDWEKVFENDGINHLDIISTHEYYIKDNPLNSILDIISIFKDMAGWGVQKEIWITETGLRTMKDNRHQSEQIQADKLIEFCEYFKKSPFARKVFFYELRDMPDNPGWGLFREDGSPKPAAEAYRNFILQNKCK